MLDVGSTLHQFIHEFVPATVKARQQEDMNKMTLQEDWVSQKIKSYSNQSSLNHNNGNNT